MVLLASLYATSQLARVPVPTRAGVSSFARAVATQARRYNGTLREGITRQRDYVRDKWRSRRYIPQPFRRVDPLQRRRARQTTAQRAANLLRPYRGPVMSELFDPPGAQAGAELRPLPSLCGLKMPDYRS